MKTIKITGYHISIALGLLILYLSYLLITTFYDMCFICYGISPTVNENLFCFGILSVLMIGLIFITIGIFGFLRRYAEVKEIENSINNFKNKINEE